MPFKYANPVSIYSYSLLMAKEFVVSDWIVLRAPLDWRESGASLAPRLPCLQAVTGVLAQFSRLAAGTVFMIYGRAHRLILPHPANPEQGAQWIPKLSGGGTLKLALSRVDEPAQRVYLRHEVGMSRWSHPAQPALPPRTAVGPCRARVNLRCEAPSALSATAGQFWTPTGGIKIGRERQPSPDGEHRHVRQYAFSS